MVLLKETRFKKDLAIGVSSLTISLLLFYWHINEQNNFIHILLYFVLNTFCVFAVIHLWRCADCIKLKPVIYISMGTMIIFGLHRILMGVIDFSIEKSFHLSDATYTWTEAACIALGIELLLLPLIIYSYRHYPLLLGKKKQVVI